MNLYFSLPHYFFKYDICPCPIERMFFFEVFPFHLFIQSARNQNFTKSEPNAISDHFPLTILPKASPKPIGCTQASKSRGLAFSSKDHRLFELFFLWISLFSSKLSCSTIYKSCQLLSMCSKYFVNLT